VKTKKYANPQYIGDPINAVKIFNDLETDELVFLDIDAANEGRTISIDLVRQIGDEAYMPFGVGGGIKDVKIAAELIAAGAEKVILNTAVIEQPNLVTDVAMKLGNQSVVVSIDINKTLFGSYFVFTKNGQKKTSLHPLEAAQKAVELGAGELILNFVPNDGMMLGYNLSLIKDISSAVSIPVVASCGAGSLEHMKDAVLAGAHAIAAGSMFVYHGARRGILINYPSRAELVIAFSNLYENSTNE
jgi:cyclase